MKRLFSCAIGLVLLLPLLAAKGDREELTERLDKQVNDWHLAASNANLDAFFGAMSDDFIYLGTAPGERWTKQEFHDFSKPYFDKGSAWDFKPHHRNWVIDQKRGIAWFDEDLDTWMEDCRGSGILRREKKEWKLVYYNLTVLIENEKITEFIELRRQ